MLKLDFQDNLNFAASGTFISDWQDTSSSGLIVNWLEETVTSNVPVGSSVTLEYRSSDTQDDNAVWASSSANLTGRYIQAKATLQKTAEATAPSVSSITLPGEAKNFEETVNLISKNVLATSSGTDISTWTNLVGGANNIITKEGNWYRWQHTGNSGLVQRRGYVDLTLLEDGEIYTISAEFYNDGDSVVNVAMDFCDAGDGTGVQNINPGETKTVDVSASKSAYTSVFRFFDIQM